MTEPYPDYATTIPHMLFMVYQMMFAIITPAIISGAVVERMSFRSYLIFTLCWATLVYDTVAHWIWAQYTTDVNGETMVHFGWLRGLGSLDFAGGTAVHMTSGWSALVAAIIVGRRKDIDLAKNPPKPANTAYVLLGGALLWFGWFGFNSGSALSSGGLAVIAFVNTQVSTGTAFVVWILMDIMVHKKATAVGAISGAVVGLVAITPAAGFVHIQSSIAIGGITTVICYGAVHAKGKWAPRYFPGVDDSLDVFSCHGVGGMCGCILTGFFASKEVNPLGADGVFFGSGWLLAYQIVAVLATMAWSVVVSLILLVVLKYTIGLKVSEEGITLGLDFHVHGSPHSNLDLVEVSISSERYAEKSQKGRDTEIQLNESAKSNKTVVTKVEPETNSGDEDGNSSSDKKTNGASKQNNKKEEQTSDSVSSGDVQS
eukprot:TRINITY_DN353_c0_g1_i1.p1 TRINITY_DN353_c0_g1~~TRINITY_DN353_c0_g1_i1.p1  ORF type:complete len:429 (+),score=102.91 TRINITY_DN353_c0_g1_i1:735-2021(+)